jgi:DNA-binding winged helix-turn-helix (wHTH) protein/tetratricopeptide (TPR) repeat protein
MSSPVLRFAAFELHPATGELRRSGEVIKLAPQPFKVLELLARRGGEVVTRLEIRDHVWHGDTFVDFDQGLNFCIRQIREVLGDTADAPKFIETLPRRGYRFLMPVTESAPGTPVRATRLIVLPFRMLRPDPETEFLAFSLPDAVTSTLGGLQSLVVRSSMTAARFAGDTVPPNQIGVEADVDAIVTGTLLRSGPEIRVATQLTAATTGALLWSQAAQTPVGDLFRVQDELARRIVASLSLPLTNREQQMLRRDVPSNPAAYEYFLRGNQLSHDASLWSVARELYLQSVEEDPEYAPAWARLGRIHHVMAKYQAAGTQEGFDQAQVAFRRALDLNPDLPIAHKLLAQLEVDLGRADDAMVRLLERAHAADPELLAGLVSTCRYCGLLDASVAAHARALSLEPKIRTSVGHTWFLQADHARVVTLKIADYPYIVAISHAELGRSNDVLPLVRELEQKLPGRLRDFVGMARTMLEGHAADSIAAAGRIVNSDFRDPEGLFYVARHLARLREVEPALTLLERVVASGYFCFPTMARDPWLDALRRKPAFTALLRRTETLHREALAAFERVGGRGVLGAATPPSPSHLPPDWKTGGPNLSSA